MKVKLDEEEAARAEAEAEKKKLINSSSAANEKVTKLEADVARMTTELEESKKSYAALKKKVAVLMDTDK